MAEGFQITIKSFMDLVPTFNGEDPNGLTKFLQSTDALMLKGFDQENPNCEKNQYLLRFIRSKIIDKADQKLTPLDDSITDYPTLKAALSKCYTDPRSLSTLIREANRTKQNPHESAESFVQRFTLLRNAINKRIRSEYPNSDGTLRAAMDKMLITSFLYEVQGSIGQYLRTRQPETFIEIANYSTLYRTEQPKQSSPSKVPRTNPAPHNNFKSRPPQQQWQPRPHNGNDSNNQNKQHGQPFRNPNNFQNHNRQFQNNQSYHRPAGPTPMSGVQTIRHQHHNIEVDRNDA